MNKSLEFVNNRLSERGKATLKKENVSVFRPSKIYKDKVAEFSFSTTLEFYDDSIPDILVELTETPEDFSNFDCYGYHSEHNDGTLIFIPVAAEEILNKFLSLRCCPSSKIDTEEDLIGVKKIKIMVGDIIAYQQDDESPVPEKPWMTNKLEVFIPAYFELIKE